RLCASCERSCCAHGQRAVRALRPERNPAGVVLRSSADIERCDVEQWGYGTELEAPQHGIRALPPQQIDQQRGEQRSVDNQPRIAFDLRDVASVVMDAMAIEGERRIAKQED